MNEYSVNIPSIFPYELVCICRTIDTVSYLAILHYTKYSTIETPFLCGIKIWLNVLIYTTGY